MTKRKKKTRNPEEPRKLTPFGKLVRKKIIDNGMKDKELASKIGCARQYLEAILYGERSGEKYIARICEELKINNLKYVS